MSTSPFVANLLEALQRLGIALIAGVLVGAVPFCLGRVRNRPKAWVTVAWLVSALVFAAGAAAFIWYLWVNEIPHPAEPEPPAQIEVLESL